MHISILSIQLQLENTKNRANLVVLGSPQHLADAQSCALQPFPLSNSHLGAISFAKTVYKLSHESQLGNILYFCSYDFSSSFNPALRSSSPIPLPYHGIPLAATWERICEGERGFRVCAKKLLNGCGAWISEHKD